VDICLLVSINSHILLFLWT